jgi:L-ascorbate metabolism protein UlaG (beta-lactamase superfamily)
MSIQMKRPLLMTYIGGPTVLIQFGGVRLLTDPTFDPEGVEYNTGPVTLWKTAGPAIRPDALGNIDAVLLSHDHHSDNLDPSGRAMLPHAQKVFTTLEGAKRLGDSALGLAPWQSVEVAASDGKRLRITGTPARHGPEGGDRGPVIGFILQFTDAPEDSVYVSGDTVWYEGVEQVIRTFPIRAAVLFLGAARVPVVPSHLTFTATEAIEFSRALPEAIIVPVHFEGWKHFSESKSEIQHAFAVAGVEDRLRWLEPGIATSL